MIEQPGKLRLSDGLAISANEQFWWDDTAKRWIEIQKDSGIWRQIQRELHGAPEAVMDEPPHPGFWSRFGHAVMEQAQRDAEARARRAEARKAESPAAVLIAQPARPTKLKVKSYKDEKDFEHDAKKMIRDGWELKGQSSKAQKTAALRTLGETALIGRWGTLLLGSAKKGDTITATWVK